MRVTTTSHADLGRTMVRPRVHVRALWTAVGVAGALVAICALDQATGAAPVQHLYYVPITLAAASFGTTGGSIVSIAAIVLYHLANPRLLALGHEHWDIVQVTLFLAVGLFTAKLTADKRRLHALATTDDLTGLHNLRSFEARLALMVRAARAERSPVALLVLDVDRLKAVNDAHGHLAGAEAVRTVGQAIAALEPDRAVACRYGGDEFVVAVPRCSEAAAWLVAEEIRGAVSAVSPVLAGRPFPPGTLTVSIGVASRVPETSDARDDALGETLFRLADAALYRAKAGGRNGVAVA